MKKHPCLRVSARRHARLRHDRRQGLVPGAAYYGVDVYGDTGNVYLTDLENGKAYVLNPAGTAILAEFDGSDSPDGAFEFAPFIGLSLLAVDQSNGDVLVSDIAAHGVVDEFNEEGEYVTTIANSPVFTDAEPYRHRRRQRRPEPQQGQRLRQLR